MTLQIRTGSWAELQSDAKPIREQVFIQEQQIAAVDEWDAQDEISQHFVVCDGEQVIATARLLPNHSIGRVAVLASHRGQGIGKLLMQEIIQQARIQQRPLLQLSSQVHAMSFYQALGFQVCGEAYMDCGIPHIDMQMSLLAQG
ncbi:GNAT family N-acetyltransferase [Acinetobacter tandoii]|uniref:GNAT family N-acetyltransferase n=1 Tax=Acinetobacter tandoii TaxID=202954 RepID=A0A5N4WAE9_9GAMM|nr:GNAT family N-acetyltransferase [Acinetobacter tandoii]KAB1853366.1 GNAT family N-acetyltransferase [Acinetobacter tandoii]